MVERANGIRDTGVRFPVGPPLRSLRSYAVHSTKYKWPKWCGAKLERSATTSMNYCVYLIRSIKDGSIYSGVTTDLKRRIKEHNGGLAKYSSTKAPFKLAWCGIFPNKQKAYDFEKYLKSSSGFAFRNKRLI